MQRRYMRLTGNEWDNGVPVIRSKWHFRVSKTCLLMVFCKKLKTLFLYN